MGNWIKQSLIAIDQSANAILFAGWADETISARCWREREKPFWGAFRHVVDTLFWFNKDHCFNAFQGERKRVQSPIEERA